MEISGAGKAPNTSLSFRYNANNEELEELFDTCEDDPPTPQFDASPSVQSENASPKRGDKTPSILDKYFKSIRAEKVIEKLEDVKAIEPKVSDEGCTPPKDVSSSPMKEYLNRLGKRNTPETPEVKEGASTNETWKLFHDFKVKITQAVEDMKTRSLEESKEKVVPRDNSISDSEENSATKDLDHSVGDTDNQVSSLDSSIQNLSEITQPLTAKPTERESSLPLDSKNHSDSSDDTHKNLVHSDLADVLKDVLHTNILEVESGVEALEDGIDGFGDVSQIESNVPSNKPTDNVPIQPPVMRINEANFNLPPSQTSLKSSETTKSSFFNFTMYFLTFLLFLNYILFPNSNIWNGFLLGIWFFCVVSNLKEYLLSNYFSEWEPSKRSLLQLKRSSAMPPTYTIPSVKEHRPIKKYEGWINHYRFPEYDPATYHINRTTTAFMKLEGTNLRISYTKTKIGKRGLWDEKLEKVTFYQHRLYNLTGARVALLPSGIVKRRQWSKKYPICIILNEKENIQIFEKESAPADKRASVSTSEKTKELQSSLEMESAETNTSPEKRKKFVWRRREKSIPHTEAEVGKEGLRHRLVRKMHRDKKSDSVSTCTETPDCQSHDKNQQIEEVPFHDAENELATKSVTSTKEDADEELDETELSRIKEFLDDAELDADPESPAEGEWSVHVKNSKDNHSQLFLFARTGRDKHEWYRRIMSAISSAKVATSTDSSAAEERTGSDATPEGKEGIEMAVYKLSEKETVGFAKGTTRLESLPDGVTIAAPGAAVLNTLESYEKTFWPYLLKIIEQKSPSPTCSCRMLPAEVTWVNTMMARVVYDVTRDPLISARLQNRIQRKLHTLKLPSFMSPLVVTELSLAGACPLVERVSAPTWDERGVWLDADLRYDGGAYITVLTQINLMKLKEKNVTLEEQILTAAVTTDILLEEISDNSTKVHASENSVRASKHAVYDSEVEDSAESSSDDETPLVQPVDSAEHIPPSESTTSASTEAHSSSSKKKFLRMVDKIATNKYFQQVTDYKYVKRAMEGLSNTDIKLQLELHGLEGRLALNLPPPPHDRIWIGFRTNPQLVLKARPAVGARTLRFAHISNWIEQKLSKEFEKVMVLPNMEDILIELMTPTPTEFE